MDLEKVKKDWDYYCKETEENEIVDVDLHFSMAMEVGGLINKIEQQQQEIERLKNEKEFFKQALFFIGIDADVLLREEFEGFEHQLKET